MHRWDTWRGAISAFFKYNMCPKKRSSPAQAQGEPPQYRRELHHQDICIYIYVYIYVDLFIYDLIYLY